MSFSLLDGVIVVAYLAGIAAFGVLSGGRQRTARDYFLSESAVPWWASCAAVVATETSALTFLSIPGIAWTSDFSFLQLAFGYILGRIVVAVVFLPRYFSGELETAYAYLGSRFGVRMRRTASITFMATRLFADGVRLYTTAIPLALLLGGSALAAHASPSAVYAACIVVLSALTLVYVFLGGIRAVIWTDVVQLAIYIAGAAVAVAVLAGMLPDGLAAGVRSLSAAGKFRMAGAGGGIASLFTTPYSTISGLVGGMFLSMASHGSDQIIIQRVLATNTLRRARLAIVYSGIVVFFQFALFLFIGALLSLLPQHGALTANEVFADFIIRNIPSGLSGLIVAGLLAAAMSTLSGSISALSSATMMDIVVPLARRTWTEAGLLRWSRRIALAWGVALVAAALLFIGTPRNVVELALSIASYTYGGLLGVFLLGMLSRSVTEPCALAGFAAGIAGMVAVILATPLAWTWYTAAGAGICIFVGLLCNMLRPGNHRLPA
jgi:SSS family transporter